MGSRFQQHLSQLWKVCGLALKLQVQLRCSFTAHTHCVWSRVLLLGSTRMTWSTVSPLKPRTLVSSIRYKTWLRRSAGEKHLNCTIGLSFFDCFPFLCSRSAQNFSPKIRQVKSFWGSTWGLADSARSWHGHARLTRLLLAMSRHASEACAARILAKFAEVKAKAKANANILISCWAAQVCAHVLLSFT